MRHASRTEIESQMVGNTVENHQGQAEHAKFPNAKVANFDANEVLREEMGAGVHL